MEVLINQDKTVYKFVHDDGSETAIKYVGSCSCNEENRNKYSIFVSSSVGCKYSCKFCYLTTKDIKYKSITENKIFKNLKEAVDYFINENLELKQFYVKVCWMGMGEDGLIKKGLMKNVTTKILEYIIKEKNYAIGLDGVDISTIFPKNKIIFNILEDIVYLNNYLKIYKLNPNNNVSVNNDTNSNLNVYENRSIVRLFYSLHSAVEHTRQYLIPNSYDLKTSLKELSVLNNEYNINVIFHQFFIDKVNDKEEDIKELINLIDYFNREFSYFELRILRLNSCEKLQFKESEKFNDIIEELKDKTNVFKVQVSAGSEIKAACGQFLMKNFKEK